jgi:hypothetical protein
MPPNGQIHVIFEYLQFVKRASKKIQQEQELSRLDKREHLTSLLSLPPEGIQAISAILMVGLSKIFPDEFRIKPDISLSTQYDPKNCQRKSG